MLLKCIRNILKIRVYYRCVQSDKAASFLGQPVDYVLAGETLEEVSLTSEAGEELKDIIRESFLDSEFESKWQPAKIQLIHSKSLQSVYDGLSTTFVLGHIVGKPNAHNESF